MRFPPAPTDSHDWTNVQTSFDVNGHVQSRWHRSTGTWSEPKFVRDPVLPVHGLAPVFHYGQAAFEGLKAFRAPNGDINILRPQWHATRLVHSSSLLAIPPLPEEHFFSSVQLAVGLNAEYVPPNDCDGMLYVRPVIFGSGPCLSLDPPDEFLFCVYVAVAGAYHGATPLRAVILDEFDRAAPRGTGSGKVGGNYAPVMRWSQMAKDDGFDITLHLDSQTRSDIEEFSTSAFIGIKVDESQVTLVVPDTKNVVNSATSDSVQQLARSFGWRVERRAINYKELADFDEVIACGTAVTVVSVKSITRTSTAEVFEYDIGRCAGKLADALRDIQKGRVADRFGWLMKLQKPPCQDCHCSATNNGVAEKAACHRSVTNAAADKTAAAACDW